MYSLAVEWNVLCKVHLAYSVIQAHYFLFDFLSG
jgi:hypothetical protein